MIGGTTSEALQERIAGLEARAEWERRRADALFERAFDRDRWGLADEARDLRDLARASRVRGIVHAGKAAAYRRLI